MKTFELDDDQEQLVRHWIKTHNGGKCHKTEKGAIGGGTAYIFFPTGVGVAASVQCCECDRKKQLTVWDKW